VCFVQQLDEILDLGEVVGTLLDLVKLFDAEVSVRERQTL